MACPKLTLFTAAPPDSKPSDMHCPPLWCYERNHAGSETIRNQDARRAYTKGVPHDKVRKDAPIATPTVVYPQTTHSSNGWAGPVGICGTPYIDLTLMRAASLVSGPHAQSPVGCAQIS